MLENNTKMILLLVVGVVLAITILIAILVLTACIFARLGRLPTTTSTAHHTRSTTRSTTRSITNPNGETMTPQTSCGGDGGGGGDTCSAIDPVNDPAYNMRNVTKQSILLEEHLAEENKYCMGCITKHFLHIIGLVEEAIWLAGSRVDAYPHLAESSAIYETAFRSWMAARTDRAAVRSVLDTLRQHRRLLIEAYFLREE